MIHEILKYEPCKSLFRFTLESILQILKGYKTLSNSDRSRNSDFNFQISTSESVQILLICFSYWMLRGTNEKKNKISKFCIVKINNSFSRYLTCFESAFCYCFRFVNAISLQERFTLVHIRVEISRMKWNSEFNSKMKVRIPR